jgi:hypothetical protein
MFPSAERMEVLVRYIQYTIVRKIEGILPGKLQPQTLPQEVTGSSCINPGAVGYSQGSGAPLV